jgi:hypothetical protein
MNRIVAGSAALVVVALVVIYYRRANGIVPDAALASGRSVKDFPETDTRVFDAMDGGVALSPQETRGRNTWILWTAGNQRFWDVMARQGTGTGDLLKAVDSRRRHNRFHEGGLINQPDFKTPESADRYGLWIDEGPQELAVDASVYGRPSGVIGLRLFPNPAFDANAASRWNAERYYTDRSYFEDTHLVRPYMVGMTCGFCHVAFNPERPPKDPESPQWSELSSAIGNQYLRASRVFAAAATPDSFAMQVLQSWPRGTIDTSFLATDHLNNPSSINPIFSLASRLTVAHEEEIGPGSLSLPGEKQKMSVPRVLKDGADSVGIVGALSRVYVSIGEYSEEWLRDHDVLVGARPQRPFSIARAQQGSVYWQTTATKLDNVASFLMRMTPPKLQAVSMLTTVDAGTITQGKIAFAEHCAGCHSSKQPGDKILRGSPEYRRWMDAAVVQPDFLSNNFLSTEERIPLTTVRTNAARALATNATGGHVWNDFSSDTYKGLSSAGFIEVQSPLDGSPHNFELPSGGPGYYRVPTLQGIWATAPLLHNKSIGDSSSDPSTAGRVAAFEDAMTKLLWPQLRSPQGTVLRTTEESYLTVPVESLPWVLHWIAKDGALRLGPIPAGTPIDLLASADFELRADQNLWTKIRLLLRMQSLLLQRKAGTLSAAEGTQKMQEIGKDLFAISKCPDFVEDDGHTFGTEMSDGDKRALIEFMKTF